MSASPPFAPACMDARELASWTEFNGRTTPASRAATPCQDCLPLFAVEMRAVGRCNGIPRGSEEKPEMDPVNTRTSATMMRVTTVAPCPTCVHARVCRLRPAGELLIRAEMPDMDAALEVTLTATVDCSEYARAKGGAKPQRAGDRPKRTYSPERIERARQGNLARIAANKAGAAA